MDDHTIKPLVTIGILSYNRCDDLRTTLNHILSDAYQNTEVLLLDNASTDGTRFMLSNEFASTQYPQLRFILNETNMGVAARNNIFQEAKGKYLFSFDDDSYPSTHQVITHAVAIMESDPTIAALCCSCLHPVTGYNETKGIERFASKGDSQKGYDIINIAPGGTMFRMEDIRKTSGFDWDFFYARDENDLAFQLVQHGKRIVFDPSLVVYHLMSLRNREIYTRIKFFTRNTLWLFWKYFPLLVSIPMIFLFAIRRYLPCIKDWKRFVPVTRGLFDGITGYQKMRKKAKRFTLLHSFKLWRTFWKILYE